MNDEFAEIVAVKINLCAINQFDVMETTSDSCKLAGIWRKISNNFLMADKVFLLFRRCEHEKPKISAGIDWQ